jgi:hydroxypyruvate reductase
MAAGVEQALGPDLVQSKVTGWVNVPLDCVRPLQRIHLHAARPPGVNEPTAQGVLGSEAILKLVASLTDDDLCLVLISGGGSALLPAPTEGISLVDKLAVTRCLMNSGATIQQLNTVRKRLSRIKGGGLLRAASAGRMVALIISDVPGDPLDIIASGPTVCDTGTAQDAIQVLEQIVGPSNDSNQKMPSSVWNVLKEQSLKTCLISTATIPCRNCVIGNNRTAVDAAANYARSLGYEVRDLGSDRQGIAREMGVELAERCLDARKNSFSTNVCFVAGGEPVVKLAETKLPRRGGRNQEFALAAGQRWWNDDTSGMALLSGGTDGEDGPTDAAGAIVDSQILKSSRDFGLNPEPFLAINDSYTYFDRVGGLLKTGPTHTNVMDLQIALVAGVQK